MEARRIARLDATASCSPELTIPRAVGGSYVRVQVGGGGSGDQPAGGGVPGSTPAGAPDPARAPIAAQ